MDEMNRPEETGTKVKKSFKQMIFDTFVPSKKDTSRQLMSKILAIVSVVLVLLVIVIGVLLIRKYTLPQQKLDELNNMYQGTSSEIVVSGDVSSTMEPAVWEPEPFVPDAETGLDADFTELYKRNSDVVGYIEIKDTLLKMPVVQGDDNAYYLNRDFDKQYDPFGNPYVDYRATISEDYQSDNITIYGHASKSGNFFAPVKLYKDATLQYYKDHPTVTFNTIYGKGEYKVIAVMLVNTDIESAELFNFHDNVDMNEEQFNAYIKRVREHSYFENPDVDVQYGDQLLTLSTCDDEIIDSLTMPYRVALVARKVRPGEKLEVDVSQVVPNEDVTMPVEWIKKFGVATPFDR